MDSSEYNQNQAPWAVIIVIVIVVVGAVVAWQFFAQDPKPVSQVPDKVDVVEVQADEQLSEEEPAEIIETETAPLPEPLPAEPVETNPLPSLNDSDAWVQENLADLTWRKELLKLVVNEDMVRRFVVFTDNFSRGILAYEYSPFAMPTAPFTALEEPSEESIGQSHWLWDENSSRRFSLYVDLLRSIDSDTLVEWYLEAKPLINQAYAELGYPEDDFTQVLQSAIARVLDFEIPKEPFELVRPSVMYQYKDPKLEALADSDKLLLRFGKDNLLVIKSVLLEINEKLARESNN